MQLTPAMIVDAIIAMALMITFVSGWRQGALTSILAMVGVTAGVICGIAVAPIFMAKTANTALRFLMAIGILLLLGALGNWVGGLAGASLRDAVRTKKSQRIDSACGSVMQVLAALTILWLIAIPLATGTTGAVAKGVRGSAVLGTVDRVSPGFLDQIPARISALLNDSGLPPMMSPFNFKRVKEVPPPVAVFDQDLVARLRPSVIHVLGDATKCRKKMMGSGFVIGPDTVITNAHVVAGTTNVSLDTVLGTVTATVVFYDPAEDIAVLHSEGLNIPPLEWAHRPAVTGDDVVVMGFPESGPFEAAPARIREKVTVDGPDIYATGRTERKAYTVRGTIRQGNSGGPIVNTDGEVIGVVFGASIDTADTGFALTSDEVSAKIGDTSLLTRPVNTRTCIGR